MTDHQEAAGKILVSVDEDLSDLIPGYLENRAKDIREIASSLERGDFETIRTIGHKMKGSGAGYGFDRITEIGRAIEDAAGRSQEEEICRQAGFLKNYIDRVEVIFTSE